MSDRFVLVLARTPQEGSRYAQRVGLRMGRWRSVASASSIRGIQVADLHILPSFAQRLDKHAIMSEFRWARDIREFPVEMPEPEVVDQGDGMGPQLDMLDLLNFDRGAEVPSGAVETVNETDKTELVLTPEDVAELDAIGAEVAEVTFEPKPEVEKPKKPRRKRCVTCGIQVTGPEDPAHDVAAHRGDLF